MIVWRDIWTDTPDVVILAETEPERGVLYDAALFLRVQCQSPVKLFDKAGGVHFVIVPAEHSGEAAIITGIDLTVTPPPPSEA